MDTTTGTGIPAWGAVLALLAAPACSAGSSAAQHSPVDGGRDATAVSSPPVSPQCPTTACTGPKTCAPWAALCTQSFTAGEDASFCGACSGSNDSPRCDSEFCASAYPALADAGTVFGDCDTTAGRCRCFVISDDGGRSGYLDDGGVSCERGNAFDGGPQQPQWQCPLPQPFQPGMVCRLPTFSPQVYTVTLWFEDDVAPQGGWTVTLGPDQSTNVGGHVYRNSGGGMVGAGPLGTIEGDVLLDVDGVPGQLRFHHSGCATEYGPKFWQYQAAITRTNALCPGCPSPTTGTQYSITSPSDGSTEYDFTIEAVPAGCGAGVDLLGFVTR